jgi:4-amino-4-deoxy-L-arabinose transferase-like glycosyltransferase
MAILAALIAGIVAGWAFARGRGGRLAHGALAGLLGTGAAAVVAGLAGDEPLVGASLGIAAGALMVRGRRGTDGLRLDGGTQEGGGPLPLILLALLLLRLGVALGGGLPLGPDEAQYWDWSRSLDLAYYSKPGGIAWLLAGWCALAGDTLVALRLLGVLLATATLALAWQLARSAGAEPWLATVLAAVLPLHALTAGLVTTDVPLSLCWTAFLLVLLRTPAAGRPPAWWHAPALGALLAAGLNAKYAMLYAPLALLPAMALPQARAWLRTPAPWLAVALGLLGFLPVLLWNRDHDWVGLLHLAGQGGAGKALALRPDRLLEFVGGQLAAALPIALLLPWAMAWAWRGRAERPALWLLAGAALVPLAVLLPVSLQTKVQANWPALAWIPAAIVVAAWLTAAAGRRARLLAGWGVGLALLAAVLAAAAPALRQRFPALPPSVPERKLAGFEELAVAVDRLVALRPERTVTLTAGYDLAAELAWHNRHLPRPLCANFGRRMNQYDLWGRFDAAHAGWDAVFACELERDDRLDGDLLSRLPAGLRDDFAAVGVPQLVRVAPGGALWRTFLVVRLARFDGNLDSARLNLAW